MTDPRYAVLPDRPPRVALETNRRRGRASPEILAGADALADVAAPEADAVMAAIVGAAGLATLPLAAAPSRKSGCCWQNKGGPRRRRRALHAGRARRRRAAAADRQRALGDFPVLAGTGRWPGHIDHRSTTSGGPFRKRDPATCCAGTPDQACAHPAGSWGARFSVDSATMMNKALEIIEARWLFDLDPARIRVAIHQSIVHSMVVCRDHSVLAQLEHADMRVPIAYGLSFPQRIGPAPPSSRSARWPGSRSSRTCAASRAATGLIRCAHRPAARRCKRGQRVCRRSLPPRSIRSTRFTPSTPRCFPTWPRSAAARPRSKGPARARRKGAAAAARRIRASGLMLITLVAFVVTLGVLIVVHEYGHYRVAIACGVKVLRFSIASAVSFGDAAWVRTAPSSSSPRCRWAASCACSTSARAQSRRPNSGAPSTVSRSPGAAPSSLPGPGNLGLAVLLYAIVLDRGRGRGRSWSAPAQNSVAGAPDCAGDLVRAESSDGEVARRAIDVRSALDADQGVLRGERRHLLVSDAASRATRNVVLELERILPTRSIRS